MLESRPLWTDFKFSSIPDGEGDQCHAEFSVRIALGTSGGSSRRCIEFSVQMLLPCAQAVLIRIGVFLRAISPKPEGKQATP